MAARYVVLPSGSLVETVQSVQPEGQADPPRPAPSPGSSSSADEHSKRWCGKGHSGSWWSAPGIPLLAHKRVYSLLLFSQLPSCSNHVTGLISFVLRPKALCVSVVRHITGWISLFSSFSLAHILKSFEYGNLVSFIAVQHYIAQWRWEPKLRCPVLQNQPLLILHTVGPCLQLTSHLCFLLWHKVHRVGHVHNVFFSFSDACFCLILSSGTSDSDTSFIHAQTC